MRPGHKLPGEAPRLVVAVAALIAVAYAVVAIWAGYAEESRGVALGPDLPVLSGGEMPYLGINAALHDVPADERRRGMELLREGGYEWVRQPFPWRQIEPGKGQFRWQQWDDLVRDYRESGLRIVAVLDSPPDWTREDNNWPNRPPDRFEDFGDFVAVFAAHYLGQIDYLQIWDEPNVFPNWGNRPVDPAGYAGMLRVAAERIRQVSPKATVVLAGLAPNGEPGGRNMNDLLFLDALYRLGAGPYFDIAAAKPYGLWHGPEDRRIDPNRANFGRVVAWRETMVAHGDQTKPIWAVEFGWNALPEGWTGASSPWGSATPEEQAAHTVAALRRARSEWPWLPVLMLQGYLPGLPAGDPKMGFSIVDASGQPRPVYEAVSALASSVQGAPTGFHPAASRYIVRHGAWEEDGDRVTAPPGSRLRLRFEGARLDLVVDNGPNAAPATVLIDRRPANRLPRLGETAVLETTFGRAARERVTVADGLTPGEHELELEVIAPAAPESATATGVTPGFGLAGFYVVQSPVYGWRPWATLALVVPAVLLSRRSWTLASRRRLWQASLRGVGRACGAMASRWRGLTPLQRDLTGLAGLALAGAGGYLAPPLLPAAAAALVGIAALCPTALVYALLGAAPLNGLPVTVGSARFAPTEVLALAAGAGLIGRWAVAGVRKAGRRSSQGGAQAWPGLPVAGGFGAPILIFVAASAMAAGLALHRQEALRELRTVVLEPLVLYALVLNAGWRRGEESPFEYAGRLSDALVAVGAALAIVGLVQYVFTDDVITAEGVRRLRAFYGSPNNVGLFLGRIAPLALCVFVGDARRRWYGGALAVMLAALVLSFSLGAWLGVAAAALFIAAWHGRRVMVQATVGLGVLFGGTLVSLQVERVAARFDLGQGTTGMRLLLWQGALNMLRDHPLLGVGPDNFLRQYRDRYMLAEAWREPNLSHPHNLVLDFWLRTGLLGLAAGVWLLARFFAVGDDLCRSLGDPAQRALVLGLLASMVDFVVHGLVDNSLFLVDLALGFWLSCAVLELMRQGHYNRDSVR